MPTRPTTTESDLELLEAQAQAKRDAEMRLARARALGGLRALDVYKAETFKASAITAPPLAAAVEFNRRADNLYLWGPTGTGKSWLAAAAARKIFDELNWGRRIRTLNEMQLSRLYRSCPDAAAEEALVQELGSLDVLVLQDLGVAKVTEFLGSLLYEVIDWRYQNKPGGLIVTANVGRTDLSIKYGDDRIADRLTQMCGRHVYSFVGEPSHRVPPKEGA